MNLLVINLTAATLATMLTTAASLRAQGPCAAPFNFRGGSFLVEGENQTKYRVRLFRLPQGCTSVLLTVTNTSFFTPETNIEIPIAVDRRNQVTYQTISPGQSFSIITSDRRLGKEPCFLPCAGCDSSCIRGSEVRTNNKEATGQFTLQFLSCGQTIDPGAAPENW